MKLVLVSWGDAHGRAGWLTTQEALSEHKPSPCFTVGWVMKDDKTGITLAASIGDEATVSEVTFVPRGMVQKVTSIAMPKAETRKARKRKKVE